jgi:hypothetical protein
MKKFIENSFIIFVSSLVQQCKRKNFLFYVHYIYCLMAGGGGGGEQRTAAPLVETAVVHDSSAAHGRTAKNRSWKWSLTGIPRAGAEGTERM